MSVNTVILSGRIMNTPPPDFTYYPNSDVKVSFLIEQEGKKKTADGSIYSSLEYFTVVAWNNDVPNIDKVVKENYVVLLYGKLKMIEVKNKGTDNVTRRVIIVAETIKLLDRPK